MTRFHRGVTVGDSKKNLALEYGPFQILFYEIKPYFCLALGMLGVKMLAFSQMGKLSAFVLAMCGVVILYVRFQSRGYFK